MRWNKFVGVCVTALIRVHSDRPRLQLHNRAVPRRQILRMTLRAPERSLDTCAWNCAPKQSAFRQSVSRKRFAKRSANRQISQLISLRKRQVLLELRAAAGSDSQPHATKQAAQALNIAFISAEVAPWSKTGGLGDVVGGLPIELARRGHNVISISPRYDQHADLWDTSVTVDIDGETVRYFHAVKEGVDRVFVDHPWFLAKVWGKTGGKLYGQKSGSDFIDNQRRFLMFNKAALKALEVLPFSPGTDGVIVANDWHTAILPVLVKEVYQKQGLYENLRVALCIHNIAFQGRFWKNDWPQLGLPDSLQPLFNFVDGYPRVYQEGELVDEDAMPVVPGSKYEKLNWLQAGVLTADKLLTVSPNYAKEIAEDDEKGVELSEAIRLAGGLEGICNGIDTQEWSPFCDKYLDVKFDATSMEEGKAIAKETLQAELGLEVDPSIPVFGFIGRLEEQKGVDILIEALSQIGPEGGIQVVVLGTGKKVLESAVLKLDQQFPDTVKGVVKFDVPLAHLMTAGADFMLVPSRFEPCGLIQLHAMSYGTVPIVASTGGLVDTVKEGVTGFHAGRFNPDRLETKDAEAFAAAIKRAADAFATPAFKTMQERCIVQELGWDKPARKWQSVLEELWLSPPSPVPRWPVPQEKAAVQQERNVTYPTPVQEVDIEGDAVPENAMAKKAAATQSILERVKPKGVEQPATPSAPQGSSRPVIPASEPVPQSPSPPSLGKAAGAAQSGPTKSPSSSPAGSSAVQSSPLQAAAAKVTTSKPAEEKKTTSVAEDARPKKASSTNGSVKAAKPSTASKGRKTSTSGSTASRGGSKGGQEASSSSRPAATATSKPRTRNPVKKPAEGTDS